MVLNEMLIK